jgi:transketolase
MPDPQTTLNDTQLRETAMRSVRYRQRILRAIHHAGAGHTGGSLSCIDLLNVLYNHTLNLDPADPRHSHRDRYIQSKGHSVEALFVVLADRGFFPDAELDSLCRYQSHFVGHPTRKVPGVEQNTGALGHGLSFGAGCAVAAKMDGSPTRVFVLLGDGELAEGSNWEAAMFAAHRKLDNVTAIIDHNTLQITGRTRDVCDPAPLAEKWQAFGFDVITIDGHDLRAIHEALSPRLNASRPLAVIANTVKGRGVSFMEDVARWHHGVPSDDEFARALAELDAAAARLETP